MSCFQGKLLPLFEIYLYKKQHYIEINWVSNNMKNVDGGAAHELLLDPFLFLTFINDIQQCVKIGRKLIYLQSVRFKRERN